MDDKIGRIAASYAANYPEADPKAIELCFRIEEAARVLAAAYQQVTKSNGLEVSAGRGAVLRTLYFTSKTGLSQVEIGTESKVTAANVTYQVDLLEKEGLVQRTAHPSDRRVSIVTLSSKGYEVCRKLFPARTGLLTLAGVVFSTDEEAQFCEYLDRFQRNLRDRLDLSDLP